MSLSFDRVRLRKREFLDYSVKICLFLSELFQYLRSRPIESGEFWSLVRRVFGREFSMVSPSRNCVKFSFFSRLTIDSSLLSLFGIFILVFIKVFIHDLVHLLNLQCVHEMTNDSFELRLPENDAEYDPATFYDKCTTSQSSTGILSRNIEHEY